MQNSRTFTSINPFSNFIKDYENGLTPNPDILCNRQIKFNLFSKHALGDFGCDAIATGEMKSHAEYRIDISLLFSQH